MKEGTIVLVTTVLAVMCIGRISADDVYTCDQTLSLCPQAYATCSCTINSSHVLYNQWYLSMPLCKGQIIQLMRKVANCSSQYQQCGSIRAWNEPQSGASMGIDICCETTTLLINAHPNLNGLMFECQEHSEGTSYGRTTLKIIAPPDAPNITAVYRLSPTQLTVVWSPASSGSPSTSFSVSISAEGISASLMNTAIVGADEKSQEYSYTFTRLVGGTTYTVSVVAINCAGNSNPVNQTGVTGLVLQKDDIIMIATSIGGAVIVLITVSILCICICFYCKRKKLKPEEESLIKRGQDKIALYAQTTQPASQTSPAPPPGPLEISPLVQTQPQRGSLGPPSLPLLLSFPAREGNINIIQGIGANYYNFGIFLLNDKTGEKVETLKLEHHSNAEAITRAILSKWLQGGGRKPIKWSTLVDTLIKTHLHALADQVSARVAK